MKCNPEQLHLFVSTTTQFYLIYFVTSLKGIDLWVGGKHSYLVSKYEQQQISWKQGSVAELKCKLFRTSYLTKQNGFSLKTKLQFPVENF